MQRDAGFRAFPKSSLTPDVTRLVSTLEHSFSYKLKRFEPTTVPDPRQGEAACDVWMRAWECVSLY